MRKLKSNSEEVKETIKLHLIEISKNDDVEVEPVGKSFSDYTWEEIKEMVKAGNHPFKVGDIKTIKFRNKIREIVIIGVNHDGDNTITCQFRDVAFDSRINEEATNEGGFAKSDLYKYLNGEFKEELTNALEINVGSNIFLPSEFEVFGKVTYSEKEDNDKQYEYFKDKRNRIKFDCDEEDFATWWWLRSASSNNVTTFRGVSDSGGIYNTTARGSNGVSPCFII